MLASVDTEIPLCVTASYETSMCIYYILLLHYPHLLSLPGTWQAMDKLVTKCLGPLWFDSIRMCKNGLSYVDYDVGTNWPQRMGSELEVCG